MPEITREDVDAQITKRLNEELPPAQRLLIQEYMSGVVRKLATWFGVGSLITLAAGIIYLFKIVPGIAVEQIQAEVVENLSKNTSEIAQRNRDALAEIDDLSRGTLVSLGEIQASVNSLKDSAASTGDELEEKIANLNAEVAEATEKQRAARDAIDERVAKNQEDVDAMAEDIANRASDIQAQLEAANAKLIGISDEDAEKARRLISLFNRSENAETILKKLEEIDKALLKTNDRVSALIPRESYVFIVRKNKGITDISKLGGESLCMGEGVPDSILDAPAFGSIRVKPDIVARGASSRGAYAQGRCNAFVVPESISEGILVRMARPENSLALPVVEIPLFD